MVDFPIEMRSPVVLAAGQLGDSPEKLQDAYNTGIGMVVTKSVTIKPHKGNPEPNVTKLDDGWVMNWVGLDNPGAEKFAEMLGKPDYPVMVSLAGSEPADFAKMVGMFDKVSGFEINVSCPNADETRCYIGDDGTIVAESVEAAKDCTHLPVFVKVNSTMHNAVRHAVQAGADGITAINTIPGLAISGSINHSFSYDGGLSGQHLLPIGLRFVRDIVKEYDIPVMGCGGVYTWKDAEKYLMVGASAVQVGTAAMHDISLLKKIVNGVAGVLNEK